MTQRDFFYQRLMIVIGITCLLGAGSIGAEEGEVVIAKYGKVVVKSAVPDSKVYVDGIYKGPAGNVIESIPTGVHTISCRTETQAVTGDFEIKKNELLQLEARFDENKFVSLLDIEKAKKAEAEKRLEAEKKIEAEKKLKAALAKPKKPADVATQEERRSPEEEKRSLHLNIIKVYFDDSQGQDVHITHKINPKVTSGYVEKKGQSGTYYRTKKDILLCDVGPCEQQWSASFVYTDEAGKADTISLTWKQTVFNGITPAGTSKRELLSCLNGACEHLEDATVADKPQAAVVGRFHLTWAKSSLIIRRADIMKQITDSGGLVDAY